MLLNDILFSKPKHSIKIFFLSNNKGILRKTPELNVEEAIKLMENNETSEVIIHVYSKSFLKLFGLKVVNYYTGKGEKAIVFLKGYL